MRGKTGFGQGVGKGGNEIIAGKLDRRDIDRQGNVMTMNKEAEQLLGWKSEELIGCSLSAVLKQFSHPNALYTVCSLKSSGEKPMLFK